VISSSEADYIKCNFWIYEHEWTFAAGYLGEPFLLEDCLVYFDGRAVNLVAFPIGAPGRAISAQRMSDVLVRVSATRAPELLHVWGSFSAPPEVRAGGAHLVRMNNDADEVLGGAFSVDIDAHRIDDLAEARKALRSAANKGLQACLRQASYFTADHFRLVEEWVRTRPIGLPSVSAMSSLPAYIRNQHVELVEVRQGGRLCGFGVVAFPTLADAVLIASFSERYPGARIEDSILAATLDVCRQRAIRRLHLGYSGSESLSHFKRKWGAVQSGPPYRDLVYSLDARHRDMVRSDGYFWPSRLYSVSTGRDQSPGSDAPSRLA
jgi:hypothetical protein